MLDAYFACVYSDKDKPETTTHYLNEEVDSQEWVSNRLLTDSSRLGEHGQVPYTIIRANGHAATSWSDKDYEDMAKSPAPEPQRGKERDELSIVLSRKIQSLPTKDDQLADVLATRAKQSHLARARKVIAQAKRHARVQVTQYTNGKYHKGCSGNFEVAADFITVFAALKALKSLYPKQKSPTKVRVQIQNKTRGKMVGGRNLSLSACTVDEVLPKIEEILDSYGWLSPAPMPGKRKTKGNHRVALQLPVDNGVQTGDGSRKPGESLGNMRPPTPNRHHTSKSRKGRESLADIKADLARLKATLLSLQ